MCVRNKSDSHNEKTAYVERSWSKQTSHPFELSADPYDYWDADQTHGRGILSLKHAAVLAGLGVMGKNKLPINRHFGNMIWLGAVLTDVGYDPDPAVSAEVCGNCSICLDSCPQGALNGETIDQKRCREHSISVTEGGGWVLSCNICRKVCPNHNGTDWIL
jgi:epoxyqueuosine reductase QueG